MSLQHTHRLALFAALTVLLLGLFVTPSPAAPSVAQTQESRANVDRALERVRSARERSAALSERRTRALEDLDRLMAEQQIVSRRLRSRTSHMYRSGDTSFISVLLGAATFSEFTTRWDLLLRMNRQDAIDLAELQRARRKAERTAKSLIDLQSEQARALEAVDRELDRARKELAADQAALAEFQSRAAAAAASARSERRKAPLPKAEAPAPPAADSQEQQMEGSGAWKTGVASHYGRNFTGRGASGERIGPYSMIVAHKTLPFGTLVEFEYGGKRAVARVADRGPFTRGRDFDLGPGVVRALDFEGVHTVRYRIIKR